MQLLPLLSFSQQAVMFPGCGEASLGTWVPLLLGEQVLLLLLAVGCLSKVADGIVCAFEATKSTYHIRPGAW